MQLDAVTRAEVAEKYAQVLADNYVYADLGAKMAASIRAKIKANAYARITSPLEFARALEADARAIVDDRHLRVGFSPQPIPERRSGPPSPEMLTQMRRQNADIPEVRILDGNIGYMAVNGMLVPQAAKEAIAAAFAFLHNTDALIIDLRGNPGGNGSVDFYMSYLSEGAPYLINTVHWRQDNRVQEFRTQDLGDLSYGAKKPVFALTSHWTFSAAEELAYDLQSFKRGVIVGETTGGGANPSAGGGNVSLGHGFSANVPTGHVVNPITGTNWEGVGVKPDIEIPAEAALTKAWSTAADRLKASATDPQIRAFLEDLSLAKLDGPATLANAQLVGRYVSTGGGFRATIVEKDGKLYQQRQGAGQTADVVLVSIGGDRFRPEGFPSGFSVTFLKKDGRVWLLQLDPRASLILEKQ
jgi:hypothetical protein